jgi:hypothetical protein
VQQFRDHVVQYAYPLLLAGMVPVALGAARIARRAIRDWRWWMLAAPLTLPVYLVERTRRALTPLLLSVLGLALATAPAAIDRLIPIDLGPRDEIVNGERHLTLTGWDRTDYADLLRPHPPGGHVRRSHNRERGRGGGVPEGVPGQGLPLRGRGRPGDEAADDESDGERLRPLPDGGVTGGGRGRRGGNHRGGALDAAAIEALWGQLTSRITSHFMANYLARIAAKCPDDGGAA